MASVGPNNRYDSLDALRGLSIFGMLWSGLIPFGVLPAFMYHIQVPPPDHIFNPNLPGISWVDLVFPAFIFCMGVAIPLALHARIKKGATVGDLFKSILKRYALLVVFAWVVGIAKGLVYKLTSLQEPYLWMESYDLQLLCLASAVLLHTILGTWSRKKFPSQSRLIKTIAWLALIGWLGFLKFKYQANFNLAQVDIILLILANVYLFGALGWLVSNDHWAKQLAIFLLWAALQFILKTIDSSVIQFLDAAPWLFQSFMLNYMVLLIPAIYLGNQMLQISFDKPDLAAIKMNPKTEPWLPPTKVVAYSLFVITGLFTAGFYFRLNLYWMVGFWSFCALTMGLLRSFWKKSWELQSVILGMSLLLIGIILDGLLIEGGIKKDPVTASYLFATAGLSTLMLLGFEALSLKFNKGVLVWNGQNPLMAYVAVSLVAFPIMELTNLVSLYQFDFWIFDGNAWFKTFKAFALTYIVMSTVRYLTKFRGFYWKI